MAAAIAIAAMIQEITLLPLRVCFLLARTKLLFTTNALNHGHNSGDRHYKKSEKNNAMSLTRISLLLIC